MRIVQLTPGSGGSFYCENCLRDSDLVRAMRDLGHETLMVPLYLPILGENTDPAQGTPVFFGGINVYLQQKSSFFRRAPRWVNRLLDARFLLRYAARKAGMTRAEDLGATTISMLRGEDGRQATELDKLVEWLAEQHRPDIVCLSNALLVGLARRIKEVLNVPIACELQGEHGFLDGLPEPDRTTAWEIVRERARDVDVFIAASRFYRDEMLKRLALPPERVSVIYNGIVPESYEPAPAPPDPPVIGFLSRMCRGSGLDILAEAFILLKQREPLRNLKLRASGGKTADDEEFIEAVRLRLAETGCTDVVEILPNLDREEKLAFLRSLTVLSVPATFGEAFGLFVVEALATGVPVVQTRDGAFPELVEASGGGLLCEPGDPKGLADALAEILLNPERARELGGNGRRAVRDRFSVKRIAADTVAVFEETVNRGADSSSHGAAAKGGNNAD